MRIAYLTAGAAGMYCGSCLHDNALAKALRRLGHDAILVPTYTPIRTDESSVAEERLFFGGLNVYLQQLSPVFRWIPSWADRFLSAPRLVNWIASRSMGTTADKLGALTVSMLRGADGNQRKEVSYLCDWLQREEPEVVVFSNLLIAGCIPEIQRRMRCPTVVILQGDDIFYDSLTEPFRDQAIRELQRLAKLVDRFVVPSRDYGSRMQHMLGFRDEQLALCPLGIDVSDFQQKPAEPTEPQRKVATDRTRIGYIARLAPEKGLDILIDAFLVLCETNTEVHLDIAGWLGKQHESYWQEQEAKLLGAGLEERFTYHGEVDREAKLALLNSIHVLSVPTPYLEPKGLFVLEALAAGVPYVQPAHGAFPELHERFQGGVLFPPESADVLAETLREIIGDPAKLRALGQNGRSQVFDQATSDHEAQDFQRILEDLLQRSNRSNRVSGPIASIVIAYLSLYFGQQILGSSLQSETCES